MLSRCRPVQNAGLDSSIAVCVEHSWQPAIADVGDHCLPAHSYQGSSWKQYPLVI